MHLFPLKMWVCECGCECECECVCDIDDGGYDDDHGGGDDDDDDDGEDDCYFCFPMPINVERICITRENSPSGT